MMMQKKRPPDPAEQFIRLMERIRRAFEQRLSSRGGTAVTPLQREALSYLAGRPRATPSELGRYLGLSSSAVAQLIERLLRSRCIVRGEDPHDHRVALLSATEKGARLCMHLREAHKKGMQKILGYMPERDVQEMARIFNNLLRQIERDSR